MMTAHSMVRGLTVSFLSPALSSSHALLANIFFLSLPDLDIVYLGLAAWTGFYLLSDSDLERFFFSASNSSTSPIVTLWCENGLS